MVFSDWLKTGWRGSKPPTVSQLTTEMPNGIALSKLRRTESMRPVRPVEPCCAAASNDLTGFG